MPLPTTGVAWKVSGLNAYKGGRVRRGGLVAVLVRDYGGAATDLSPSAFSSPFAQDGQLRSDLLVTSATPNQGWYLCGALLKKGVDIVPDMAVDNLEILQSNREIRSDLTKEGGMIDFTAVESTSLTDCLDFNMPLTTIQDDGTLGYMVAKPVDANLVERQLILIRSDQTAGLVELTAMGFPRVALDKINKRVWDKTNPDALDISFRKLLDPFAVDAQGSPAAEFKWRDGAGWRAAGGSPVFPAPAPVALATTSGKATLTFATPTGIDIHPITYTGQKSTDAGVTWVVGSLLPPIPTSTAVGGNTVLTFQTLTAGPTMLRAIATGTNGLATTSLTSNSVTIT